MALVKARNLNVENPCGIDHSLLANSSRTSKHTYFEGFNQTGLETYT